jgi:hypothetical protein
MSHNGPPLIITDTVCGNRGIPLYLSADEHRAGIDSGGDGGALSQNEKSALSTDD